ncbi:MAG TPA: trypsin-like peptidase domain-containing protein, partial [Thermomicrobiales bacterium]|nr:trypsin-like peptidase domain-containing protein [Thermomicrobiales bacterium]
MPAASFVRAVPSNHLLRWLLALAACLPFVWTTTEAAPGSGWSPPASAAQTDMAIPDLVDQVLPAVVTVYNLTTFNTGMGSSELQPQGSGTGFVISEDGYIITNWHVVTGGEEFAVMFSDGDV